MGSKNWAPFILALVLAGCATPISKVQFDLGKLNRDGLQGPEDGLRALSYEFCIPSSIEKVEEVMVIDKTLVVYHQSPGRVGCGKDAYLAVGNTSQDGFREVLRKLSELDYVESIYEAFFE
ncbi:MAG: hypothetical protein ACR2PT_05765 [Endozoicomonas sp.]